MSGNFDHQIILDKSEQINKIRLTDIVPASDQPRKTFEQTALNELADSIRTHGILQPLVVTPKESGGYSIIAGERRWRAAKLAGLEFVPVLVRTVAEMESLELALIENVQRVDLSPLEQADSIQRLHEQFNLSYSAIAKRLGKAETTLSNIVRLLQLPDNVREALAQSQISEGHARSILALKNEPKLQKELLRLIVQNSWSVRQAEQYVTAQKQGLKSNKTLTKRTVAETNETKALSTKLGSKVSVYHTAKGGRLQIHFKDDKELNDLYKKLGS